MASERKPPDHAAYTTFGNIPGENTHDAKTITFGMNWGFQAFGGLRLGPEPE